MLGAERAFGLRGTAHDALVKVTVTAWDVRLLRLRRRASYGLVNNRPRYEIPTSDPLTPLKVASNAFG
jgi:hypothetical protein